MKKLAQRVEETLTNDIVSLEAKQIDPNLILVDMHNRLGSSPNVQHIHKGILSSFLKNSFDRTRPAIGICVEYKSEEGIRKLLEHNQRFTKGSRYLPLDPGEPWHTLVRVPGLHPLEPGLFGS